MWRHRKPLSSRSADLTIWHREVIIQTKRKIKCVFEIFDFSKNFRPKLTLFSRKISKIHKIRIFDFLDFVKFWDFSKNIFCFGRKFFEKIKIFKNKFQFSFCLYYVLALSNFQVRRPVRKRSAVSPKKWNFFSEIFHQTSLFGHQLRDPLVQYSSG